jgi:TPR repeat protein
MKLFNILLLAFLIQSAKCYALQELPDSLYKKAEQGDVRAQESLGLCYASGDGVSENRTQAVYWFRKAAEKGYDRAQFRLGLCYDYGIGVSENRTQAVYWYRKAAEKGYDRAQYHLGLCYDNGIGVSKDYSQAVYWYRKAADQGYVKAKSKLKNVNGNKKSQKKNDVATSGSSSELPNVIDISIEKAVYIDKKNGVEEKFILDVPLLKIYRSGLIKFGKEGNMDKLMEFDNAYVENRFPNIVMFDKSDSLGFLSIETTLNLIDYNLAYDLDNRIIISLICKKSESSKIKKIVQLVKQGKFLKK